MLSPFGEVIQDISVHKCAYHQEVECAYREIKELKAQVEQYQGMDQVASATIRRLEDLVEQYRLAFSVIRSTAESQLALHTEGKA
jgi:hypothetical protein